LNEISLAKLFVVRYYLIGGEKLKEFTDEQLIAELLGRETFVGAVVLSEGEENGVHKDFKIIHKLNDNKQLRKLLKKITRIL
jgi:hypothetical protein